MSRKRRYASKRYRKSQKASLTNKILTIIGIALCVILVPILIINCTLIIQSFVNKDKVPNVGGIYPMIVLTDSMYPDIKSGDLILCQTVKPDKVEEGMVISYFSPEGNGNSIVTHQVIEIIHNEDGTLSFRTKGINNNTEDRVPVPQAKLIGRYTGIRIPNAGNVAMFMQTTYGLIVCVFIPFVLLVVWDFIRRRRNEKEQNEDMAALMAELKALKAEKRDSSLSDNENSSEEKTEEETVGSESR